MAKGWMTHDAMWFYHCVQELGIEQTNRINLAAIQSMSAIEIKRIMSALGFSNNHVVKTFDELVDIMNGSFDLVRGKFMKFNILVPKKNNIRWECEKGNCFAYEGVVRLGVIEGYQCGIMTRIKGWLQALGVDYTMNPKTRGCLMYRSKSGKCRHDFIFNLE